MKKQVYKNYLDKFFLFFQILVALSCIVINNYPSALSAASLEDVHNKDLVIEHLRLNVPAKFKPVWLEAEKKSWEPWLNEQNGFLGREMFWDKKSEEATLLISWSSRKLWKSIPSSEIASVQDSFEQYAREGTGEKTGNPFPLIFEGELLLQ